MWKKWFGRTSRKYAAPDYEELDPARIPRHIAIIMDGNGRWAKLRGKPRSFGHRAGAEALRGIVRCAGEMGIKVITAYAFSTENWKRPTEEVDLLMALFSEYLDSGLDELHANGIKLIFSGDLTELAPVIQEKIRHAEQLTADNSHLIVNIAMNYGGRAEITRAVKLIAADVKSGRLAFDDITEETVQQHLYTAQLPDPDLLIRPAGDQRISNFLLWQIAYAELWYTNINWPDFAPEHLVAAVVDYQRRDRRFGGLNK